MELKEFKSYLKDILNMKENTIKSRISNVKRIEDSYGNLDEIFREDQFKEMFFLLTLKKDDLPKHKIEIKGNQYTGTATLKAALGLYNEFKELQHEEQFFKDVEHIESKNNKSGVLKKLENVFSTIKYTKKEYKNKVDELQALVFEILTLDIPDFEWKLEEKMSDKYLDRADIIGYNMNEKLYVIIELDACRADQVSKKFLSRQALNIDKNMIYVSLCYPGTKKMSKPECVKYFEYCALVTESLNKGDFRKEYLGYYLS